MIKKYTDEDFAWLEKWITTADLLTQFAGSLWTFPLTREQFSSYREVYPNRFLYLGYQEGASDPFAMGEIIVDDPDDPRLGRLLVGDPAARGKGAGTGFIRELIEESRQLTQAETLFLFMAEDNIPAIRCFFHRLTTVSL